MSLRVSALCARYKRLQVCRDINFSVPKGELLAVLGMNGAGKSTLLGAIAGSVTASGQITVDAVRIDTLPARRRATAGVAFVPEGRRNLFPPLTVDDNLSLGLRLIDGAKHGEMRRRIYDLFPVLEKRGREFSGSLSGGEQQMLALAVAIARSPTLLLLDEPSQGLAPVVLDNIASAIKMLRTLGLTVVLAEQNHQFASSLADGFIVLQGGEIVHSGNSSELASGERAVAAILSH